MPAPAVARTSKVATTAASESFATTTEIYDRFGRLYQVTEPNNTVTRYDYDAANHLSHVCQGFTAAPVPRTGGSTTTTAAC